MQAMIIYNAKETAILIREELKNSFPSQKFSVRSSDRRVDISWTNGASANDVQTAIDEFGGIEFDGARTIYLESNYDGNIVNFRIQKPFLRRSYTEDFAAEILAKASEIEPKLMINFLNGNLFCQNDPYSCEAKIWANLIEHVSESNINTPSLARIIAPIEIMPVSIERSDCHGFGIFPKINERNCLDEYICQEQPEPIAIKIIERVQLTNDDYDYFINNLLDDYKWLEKKGGGDSTTKPHENYRQYTKTDWEEYKVGSYLFVIEVWADDRAPIFANPKGFSYCHSIAFPFDLDLRIPIPAVPEQHNQLKNKIINMYNNWVARKINNGEREGEILNYHEWLKNKIPDFYSSWVRSQIACNKLESIVTLAEWEKIYC